VALIEYLIGVINKKKFNGFGETIMKVFNAVFGVQFLLGLGMLAMQAQDGLVRQHYEHGFAMLVAVILAGVLPKRWKNLADGPRYRNHLILMIVIAALIVTGILRLSSGIQWRFLT
jgi:heme A synthase